ncbi:probable receptor-like protein kinase At5g20050 [Oryza brachyantha]|uniref:probable receptor-like protein kinase At5g20050 n=1 Tax=Oryza brachyantha TaxID=4533 RepID=UPI001ADB42A9|nr:probable receptor-like protein kinase At5g20050 [Oryza brachyantha]
MESKKAKILAGTGVAVLLVLELALYLRFRLSRPFFLATAVIVSSALSASVVTLLHHALSARRRAERMARRPSMDGEEQLRVEYSYFRKVAGLPCKFSFEALAAATDGFQYTVGRGSSGTVFKGILDDGTAVAVKRIDGADHVDKEFKSEVSAIASAQHVHLVRLVGFCLVPRGPRFLVYEYMEHGSLDKWIFPHSGDRRRFLPWAARYQVAVDVARALAYLHHDCRNKVLHLDVKPENILLDDGFRGLLSDFGLSKLMGKEQSRVVTTVRGTTGYLAPEWLLGVGITEKSDVYSYGLVLLEMVGGRRNLQAEDNHASSSSSPRWTYFPKVAADKAREGRVMEVLDRRVVESGEAVEEAAVRRLVHVALWCAQEKASARPSMARVVEMLEGRGAAAEAVEAPPPSDMIVVDLLSLDPSRGPGPFGLPPPASGGGMRATSSGLSNSFALSYLSGR